MQLELCVIEILKKLRKDKTEKKYLIKIMKNKNENMILELKKLREKSVNLKKNMKIREEKINIWAGVGKMKVKVIKYLKSLGFKPISDMSSTRQIFYYDNITIAIEEQLN